jgi:hypothetical protein
MLFSLGSKNIIIIKYIYKYCSTITIKPLLLSYVIEKF